VSGPSTNVCAAPAYLGGGLLDPPTIMRERPPRTHDREKFISGKNKQNAVKSMVVTDAVGSFRSAARPCRQAASTSLMSESQAWSGFLQAGQP
jgi:hypothetical protein